MILAISKNNVPLVSSKPLLLPASENAWQNPEERYSQDIIKKLDWAFGSDEIYGIWQFNGLIYDKNKGGVYIQDEPRIKNGKAYMNLKDLENKVKEGDPGTRFVKFGEDMYRLHTPSQVIKNKFISGLYGKEGVEKLAEVSSKYGGLNFQLSHTARHFEMDDEYSPGSGAMPRTAKLHVRNGKLSIIDAPFNGWPIPIEPFGEGGIRGYAMGIKKENKDGNRIIYHTSNPKYS